MSSRAHIDLRAWARAATVRVRRLVCRVQARGSARRCGRCAARGETRADEAARRPPRYKTAAVTWLAIYPLVLGLSTLLARLDLQLPAALSILLVTLVTVLLVTYAVLPALSWLFRPWLVPHGRKRHRDPSRRRAPKP